MNYILQKGDQKISLNNTSLTFEELKNLALQKFNLKREFTLSYVDLENDHINIQDDDDLEVCIHEFIEIHSENDLFKLPILIAVNELNEAIEATEANEANEVKVSRDAKDTKENIESTGKGLAESPRLITPKKSGEFQLIKSSLSDNENYSVKSSKHEEEKLAKKEMDPKIYASQPQFDVKNEMTDKNFSDIESQISDKVLGTLGSKIEEQISNQMDFFINKKFTEIFEKNRSEKQKRKEEKKKKRLAEAEKKKEEKRLKILEKQQKEEELLKTIDSVKKLIGQKEDKKTPKEDKKMTKKVIDKATKKIVTFKDDLKEVKDSTKTEVGVEVEVKADDIKTKTLKDIQAESLNNLESILSETVQTTNEKVEEKVEKKPIFGIKLNSNIVSDKTEAIHYGIICDGCGMHPIIGTRFKCYERDDYDLCQNCEKTKDKQYVMLRIPEPRNLQKLLNGKKENVLEMKIPGIMPLMNLRDPIDPILLAKMNSITQQAFPGLCPSLKKSEALFKKKPKCHQFNKQKLNVMPCHLVKANKKDNKNSEENIKEKEKVNETEIYEEPTIFKKECIEVRAPETTIIKDCVIAEVEPKQEKTEEKIEKNEEKIEENEEKTTQNTKEDYTISDIISQ